MSCTRNVALQMFPKLTAAQIARLESHGERIATTRGQVLIEPDQRHRNLFVVLSGASICCCRAIAGEDLITSLTPGDFAGEISTLRGVQGFVRVRVTRRGTKYCCIEPAQLRTLVQTDAELSEIFMRAFILRRMGLICISGRAMSC